ncbi:MAG: hypothetical protein OK442_03545 [Thaumarchaeota archaeon]|nr:hypothetical protein [Nitrososphaerota archaeon]
MSGGVVLQSGKRRLAYVAAAILIAGVLVSAALLIASASGLAKTITSTSTTALTVTSSGYMIADASGNPIFLADCASPQVGVDRLRTLVAGIFSPIVICVRLYEFNSSSPILLNLTNLLYVQGSESEQNPFNVSSGNGNFTIVASQDQLLIGGPSNANEGIVVGYSITAKPGVNGTYGVGLPGWLVGSDGGPVFGSGCTDGELVAGSGRPDYFPGTSCFGCLTTSSGSSTQSTSSQSFTIPGAACVGYNTLMWGVIKVVNSTQ